MVRMSRCLTLFSLALSLALAGTAQAQNDLFPNTKEVCALHACVAVVTTASWRSTVPSSAPTGTNIMVCSQHRAIQITESGGAYRAAVELLRTAEAQQAASPLDAIVSIHRYSGTRAVYRYTDTSARVSQCSRARGSA